MVGLRKHINEVALLCLVRKYVSLTIHPLSFLDDQAWGEKNIWCTGHCSEVVGSHFGANKLRDGE